MEGGDGTRRSLPTAADDAQSSVGSRSFRLLLTPWFGPSGRRSRHLDPAADGRRLSPIPRSRSWWSRAAIYSAGIAPQIEAPMNGLESRAAGRGAAVDRDVESTSSISPPSRRWSAPLGHRLPLSFGPVPRECQGSGAPDLRWSALPLHARPPGQLGDEVLEHRHERIRSGQVGVDVFVAEHLAAES